MPNVVEAAFNGTRMYNAMHGLLAAAGVGHPRVRLDAPQHREMHIAVGRPISIALKANDVIHSFWALSLHGKPRRT